MDAEESRAREFLENPSRFDADRSFLLVLREWNPYTPTIPSFEEADRGGGYFLQHKGKGVVIDPGYDFIEHFHNVGGVMRDITHIIVTHAHDEHTAQLETPLMLLRKRNKELEKANKPIQRITLAMSIGARVNSPG